MHQARMSFVCKAKEAEIHPAGNGSEQLNNMCVCLFVCLFKQVHRYGLKEMVPVRESS